jgi:hypothetical protein
MATFALIVVFILFGFVLWYGAFKVGDYHPSDKK